MSFFLSIFATSMEEVIEVVSTFLRRLIFLWLFILKRPNNYNIMGEYLINLDTEIFLWFNSRNNLFWDIAMKMATGKLIWIGLYLSLVYAMYKAYGWKTTLVMTVMSGLAVTAADQMTASVLRPIFERLRPANLNNPISHLVHIVDGYRSGGFSFPSCHAANTFALATLTSLLFRRWRFTVAIVFWAIVNCYSRIYLGVHYPGDLLAGTVIGCLCGGIFYVVGRLIISYWSGCTVPGAIDRKRVASFNGKKFYYRPVDVVIFIEAMTMIYILVCAASIFV